jgi:Concanavalin A-like lectin/glucanases superfamily
MPFQPRASTAKRFHVAKWLFVGAGALALGGACDDSSPKLRVQEPTAGEGGEGDSRAGAGGQSEGLGGASGQGGAVLNQAGASELAGASASGGAPAAGAGGAAGSSGDGGAGGERGAVCGDGALSFSGTQFVQIPGTETLHLTSALTLEAWIKTSSDVAIESIFLGKHSCGTDNGYLLEIYTNSSDGAHTPNAPAFYVQGNTHHVYGTASVVDGKWHHLAGTNDGTTSTLYVDGAFVASKPVTYTNTNAVDLFLGGVTNGACRNYTGLLDEVSVWSVARTAQQIAADASAPIAKDSPGLELYFDFNRATCGKVLADRSPHGRDGLLGGSNDVTSNDPSWVTDGPFTP